jgi:uncharacterized membrane protein (UPF0127 family)
MNTRRVGAAVAALVFLAAVGLVAYPLFPATMTWSGQSYDAGTVTFTDENGTTLGSVSVRVADTADQRWTGLSDTASLPEDAGMLFVYRGEARRAFVMRDMAFALDIVFVSANGTVTAVHHAPVPPSGTDEANLTRYAGRAKWVVEVNRGWTTRHGVTVGDEVTIDYGNASSGSRSLLADGVLTE